MKPQVFVLSVLGLLPLGSALADSLEQDRQKAFEELNFSGCEDTLRRQGDMISKAKALLDERKARIAELEGSLQPLNNELSQCKSQQASGNSALQQQVAALEAENQSLKGQLKQGDSSKDNAAKLAIYASQLKGQVDALNTQLAQEKATNQKLNQELSVLKVKPNTCPSTTPVPVPACEPQVAVADTVIPVPTPTAAKPHLSSGNTVVSGGIQFELKSVRRSGANLDTVLTVTNIQHEDVYGIVVGPAPTLVDDKGNLYISSYTKHIDGFADCQYNNHVTGNRDYCIEKVMKKAFRPTQLFKNTPLNASLLFTPKSTKGQEKSKEVSLTTTVMLWMGGENFKFIPVNINQVSIEL